MREVAEVLAERGALTPAEILPELRTWTVRVSFGRYFEHRDEGRYSRKAG